MRHRGSFRLRPSSRSRRGAAVALRAEAAWRKSCVAPFPPSGAIPIGFLAGAAAPGLSRGVTALLVVLLSVACGCSPRAALERLVLAERVERVAGIPYGDGPRQTLDVYRPRRPAANAPVVIFLYGGRWKYGSKNDYLLVANTFARRGWITVIPDYRLYPEVLFPGWVTDGAAAVRWTVDHIGRHGGDSRNIFVIGHSAGGHTAALLALDDRYLTSAGVSAGTVRGYVSVAGPVDTTWTAPDVQRLMGPRETWPLTYPATHVNGTARPLLLMHGTADDVALPVSSTRLAARIQARDGCARARLYRNLNHVDIAAALALPTLRVAPVLDDLERFIRNPIAATCPRAGLRSTEDPAQTAPR